MCEEPPGGVWLSETDIRELLDVIDADEAIIAQDRGVGDQGPADWPLYQRLRERFPKELLRDE